MKPLLSSFLFSAFLLVILIGITFLGCTDNLDNTLVSTSITTENVTSSTPSNPSVLDKSQLNDGEIIRTKHFAKLKVSKFIDGEIGGEFIIDTTYFNREGRLIEVYARLKFDPGAFVGKRLIRMIPNPKALSIQLYPHMTFNTTVKLDYIITGLDLEAMDFSTNSHVDFVYFSPNGDIELIQNDLSNVHPDQQSISLQGGILNHFSRYGWSR